MNMRHLIVAGAVSCVASIPAKAESKMSSPIRLNVDSLPISMEPTKVRDIVADWVLGRTGNRLISTHADGTIKGDLALRWKVLENGGRFEFTLRDDALFSDGSPVTASDVKANIESAMAAKANFSFYLEKVKSVEAPDARTVIFHMQVPMPSFLQILGEPMFTVHKKCGDGLCFTGPYTIGSKSDHHLDIVRRKDAQIFRLERLSFHEALANFRAGKLEILRTFGVGNLLSLGNWPNNLQIRFPDQLSYFVAFNSQRGRLRQADFRQQLSANFDYESAGQWLKQAGVDLSKSLVSPTFFGSSLAVPRQIAPKMTRPANVEHMSLMVMDSHEIEPLAAALVAHLPIEVRSFPKKEFLRRASEGDFDMLMIGYNVTLRDIDYLSIFFDSKSLHNFGKVNSPSIDELVKGAWVARSLDEHRKSFTDILTLNNEQSFYIPIAHAPVIYTLSNKLHQRDGVKSVNATSFDVDNIEWVTR